MNAAKLLAAWAVLLAINDAVLWGFNPNWLPGALLGAAALATALLAAVLAVRGRGRPDTDRGSRFDADVSLSTVLIAVALGVVLTGVFIGAWMWLIGGGVLLIGAAGLLREWRAAR